MNNSESWRKQNNVLRKNSKSKIKLTYQVLMMLQETLDAYGIVRKQKSYGKLLRVCVQNRKQLQKITDIIELIFVTDEINIEEIAFPEWPIDKKFMLFIKGSPHTAIESVFDQTNIKWKMTAVEYKMPENEPMHIKVNNSIVVSENQANEENGQLQSDNDFFESQHAVLVKNTMKQMQIGKKEAENQVRIWFHWTTKDGKNNVCLSDSEVVAISEVKKCLEPIDTVFNNICEPQDVRYLLQNESCDNKNPTSCCHDLLAYFYILLIFCLKGFILLSSIILIYISYKNEKISSTFTNNTQEIFRRIMKGIFLCLNFGWEIIS